MATFKLKSSRLEHQIGVDVVRRKPSSELHDITDNASVSKHAHNAEYKHKDESKKSKLKSKKMSSKSWQTKQTSENGVHHLQNLSSPHTKKNSRKRNLPENFIEDNQDSSFIKKHKLRNIAVETKIASTSVENNNTDISASANNIRKSNRMKFPVLAFWRNQRPRFKITKSGQLKFIGIDEGTKDDVIKRIDRKRKNRRKKEKEKQKNSCEITVLSADTGEEVRTKVVKPYESLKWTDPSVNQDGSLGYYISKSFTTEYFSFGYIDILPYEAKPLQYLPDDDAHFVILKGKVEVQIYNTKFVAEEMTSFVVPCGNQYAFTNIYNTKAVIAFTVFRLPSSGNGN